MGLISIKFDQENFSSLSVNDHVYFVETNTRGDYIINSQTANYLGPVKTITPPRPVITREFFIDRDHYSSFSKTGGTVSASAGLSRLNTGHAHSEFISGAQQTFDFGDGNIAKKGDTVTFTAPPALTSYSRTISSFLRFTPNVYYNLTGILTEGTDVTYVTTSPHLKKIFTDNTDGVKRSY